MKQMPCQSVCVILLGFLAFLSSKTSSSLLRALDCNNCLLNCQSVQSDTSTQGACLRCLNRCSFSSSDLLRYFTTHQCLTREELNTMLQTSSTPPTTEAMEVQRRYCERFHDKISEDYTRFLVKHYICMTALETETEKAAKCTPTITDRPKTLEDEFDEIYRENKDSFADDDELEVVRQLDERLQSNRGPNIRSSGALSEPNEDIEVCHTIHEVITPEWVQRHSDESMVRLLKTKNKKQYFHSGRCDDHRPIVEMEPDGKCKPAYHLQKGVFELTGVRYNSTDIKFRGCRRMRQRDSLVCKDWVRINSTCTFFV